jgi:capsular polysaccharide biosynthesis protein
MTPTTIVRTASQMATPQTISPKAVLALVFPAIGTLVLALVNEFVTVHMDSTLKIAVVGVVNAALAALGAYLGAPGQVTVRE